MLTELLESDVAAIATLSSLLEEVDMELPFSGKSAVKKEFILCFCMEGRKGSAKLQSANYLSLPFLPLVLRVVDRFR